MPLPLIPITGRFYRAIDPAHRDASLQGSRTAGRYSAQNQPTLYMSASPEGVAAAMVAHTQPSQSARTLVALDVVAENIADLRDKSACTALGIRPEDAAAPWQEIAKTGGTPPSWQVAEKLRALGANGLIDPSRKAPGLWHLVLFRWNSPGAPRVTLAGTQNSA